MELIEFCVGKKPMEKKHVEALGFNVSFPFTNYLKFQMLDKGILRRN